MRIQKRVGLCMIMAVMAVLFSSLAIADCVFTDAYWSASEASAGTKIIMDLESTGCDGSQVNFDIYENDWLIDDLSFHKSSTITSNKIELVWYAVYAPDGFEGVGGFPEYYFRASLASNPLTLMDSQGPSADGLLTVSPNQMPSQPTPFLITPNRGELYDNAAIVTWNPAIDPENDSILYSLYYSDDSGATWKATPIVENYGHTNLIGGKSSLTIGFISE
jgi:hypothetical protein